MSQSGNVFTITPSTNAAHNGSFSLRFFAKDNFNNTAYTSSATFTLTSNTYVYSTTVYGISDIPSSFTNTIPENQLKFLRYTIRKPSSGTQTITVCVMRNGSTVSQSAFYIANNSFSFLTSAASAINYSNDDHDHLVMDGDGNWVLGRANTTDVAGSSYWDKGNGTSLIYQNVSYSTAFINPPIQDGYTGGYHTLVAFPMTGMSLWISVFTNQYKLSGGFSAQSFSWSTYIGTASTANSLWTISDGVNSFMIGRHSSTTAVYVEMNLSNGTIYNWSQVNLGNTPSSSNGTEEDAFGNQLFAVNGTASVYAGSYFYWGRTIGWRNFNGNWYPSDYANAYIGNSTQTGMDVFGSVGADGYVWFADWGHDDGGLFGIGNDSDLGVRKTNILMLPSNFAG